MGTIRAVALDWYNTLAAPNDDDFWTRIPELIASAGGQPDADELALWGADHPLEHREHSASELTYRVWQRRRFEDLLAASGVNEPELTRLADEIDAVRYARVFHVFPDVVDVLDELRRREVTVAVCSNWDWDLDRHLAHNRIRGHIDVVVCSAVEGYRKPHPAIFDVLISRLDADPDQILFVGDSLHDDIGGATEAGMRAVHLDRDGSCTPTPDHDSPCVRSLSGIFALLT